MLQQHLIKQHQNLKHSQFLKIRQIQPQQSDFLSEQYASKSIKLVSSQNPRDMYGTRMSPFWKQGDNVWTVTYKKIKHRFLVLLNPNTYSVDTLHSLRRWVIRQKVNVLGFLLVLYIPVTLASPFLRPGFARAHRQFLFQYYKQSSIIARQFNLKTKTIAKKQMQKIVLQARNRVSL